MPSAGLSLVGFLADQQHAISHLRMACVPDPTKTDAELTTEWSEAAARLGSRIRRAGNPGLQPIPMNDPHIQQLMQVPWSFFFTPQLAAGATFQMVEIEPLLAYQHVVDTARTSSHCRSLSKPPTPAELLNCCLPLHLTTDSLHASGVGQSIIIKSRSLNLRVIAEGPLPIPNTPDVIGVQFAWALPFVHVVRFNGRCYLHNGYHRAYGIRKRGGREMPCLFRDVPDAQAVGIQPPGTFDLPLLESSDPPTLGHFTRAGRAKKVMLRGSIRIIQISWSQHTMYDE